MNCDSLRRGRLAAALLLLGAVCLASPAPARLQARHRPRPCAIENLRLSFEEGAPRMTLILREGRIAEMRPAGEATPPGLRLIDGEGLVALPAFVDAFSRAACETPAPMAERDRPPSTVSDVRVDTRRANRKGIQPSFAAVEALALPEGDGEAWRRSGFGALLAAPGGELLSGTSALIVLREAAARELVMRPRVFAHAAFRAGGPGYPSTLMGYLAQLRQFLLDAGRHAELLRRHAEGRPGVRPPWDADLEAGVPILRGERALACRADPSRDIERWLKLSMEAGFEVVVTGGREAWKVADRLKEDDVPVVLTLDWGEEPPEPRAGDEEVDPWSYREPRGVHQEKRRRWEEGRDCALRLEEAGVRFAFGTGEGSPHELLARVRALVARGLPEEAARRGLTTAAAELLGAGDRLGAIEPGRDATFALWTANPLTDEEARVAWMIVDGFADEIEAEEEAEAAAEETAELEDEPGDQSPAALADHPIETDELRRPTLRTGGSCVIRDVVIHPAIPGSGPLRGDVLVLDGKIAALGEVEPPADLVALDGEGGHLTPGAIDPHTHLGIEGGINEDTLSITAEVDIGDSLEADDVAIFRALAGGTTSAHLMHGSANAIGGRCEVIKLRWRAGPDELRFEGAPQTLKMALGENPKRSGAQRGDERFPASRMGVEAVFYRAFERASEYRAEWAAYHAAQSAGEDPPPPRRDLRLEVLVGVLEGEIDAHPHCYRADEILMLMRAAEHFGFRVKALHHGLEAYKVAAEVAAHGAGCATFADLWGYKMEAWDAIPQNAGLLDEAGVVAAVKSDSSEIVRRLFAEAAKSVRHAGMDPEAALRLCTLNPAILLGIDHRVGSIEVGKDADLVLHSGPPLSSLSRVEWTLVDGEVQFTRRDAFGLDADPPPVTELSEAPRGVAWDPDGGETIALVGGTLHPVTGPAIEGGTLLVQDGRILAAGAGVEIPAQALLHDVHGQHVWPGLIAIGTALGLSEIGGVPGPSDLAETGGNQPDLRVGTSLNAESAHIPVTRQGGITRAQSGPMGGGPVVGQSAILRLAGQTWEELVFVDRDMLQIRFPRAVEPEEEPDEPDEVGELRALLARAREWGRLQREAAEQGVPAPAHDQRLAALQPYLAREKRVALRADDAATILQALRFAREEELDAVLIGAREAWKVVDALAREGLPVVVGPVLSLPRSEFDPYECAYANAAVLHRAGVPFAISTGGWGHPSGLSFQAAMAAAFGLPHEEAVRAITLYPARVLGIDSQVGSLSPGKLADAIVTTGDLLEIGSQVTHVFIEGRPTSLKSRQTELYERYRERLRRLREGEGGR